jgi:hypothetical protein
MRLTQEPHTPGGLDQQDGFEHVPLVLAAIPRVLGRRVVGARDGSLGASMPTRGARGVWRVGPLLRVRALAAGGVIPPPGIRPRPPHDDRAPPPRRAGDGVTQAVRHASTALPWTGAYRTSVHGAVAWGAACGSPA